MADPQYELAYRRFYGTGYQLRDWMARVISGKNPDGTLLDSAANNVFIQETEPVNPPIPSLWVVTDSNGDPTGEWQVFT